MESVTFHKVREWIGCSGWGLTAYGATSEIAWQRWLERWHWHKILNGWHR